MKRKGASNERKTHCPRGHKYTEENTQWRLRKETRPERNGKSYWQRRCATCHREEMRK